MSGWPGPGSGGDPIDQSFQPEGELFQGIKGIGVADRPSVKIQMGMTCYSCHKDQGELEALIGGHQAEISGRTEQLLAQLKGLEGKVEGAGEEAAQLYGTALANVTLVVADRSQGVHNYPYATSLLDVSEQSLTEFVELTR